MKTIIINLILIVVFFFLWSGTTISYKPFSIKLDSWVMGLGVCFLVVGFFMAMSASKLEGKKAGYAKGTDDLLDILKQDLERSKNDWLSLNVNDQVMVKLNDKGYEHLATIHNDFVNTYGIKTVPITTAEYYKAKADINGYTTFQMWDFISKFGSVTRMGMCVFYDTSILIQRKNLNVQKPTGEDSLHIPINE